MHLVNDRSKVGHQACPSCPSHDAFFVYKDGHGHCYSCGYHDPGMKSIESMKSKLNPAELSRYIYTEIKTTTYTYDLPDIAIKWLKKYDITDKEIAKYGLMWNKTAESLVFPLRIMYGQIFCTNERYFGDKKNHPKYLTKGNKTSTPYYMGFGNNIRDKCILVEDFVSAIKVGRQYTAVPLLGTTVPDTYIANLSNYYRGVTIWLDPDKKQESLFQRARVSQWLYKSDVIFSDKDPKEYSDIEIKAIVERQYGKV